MRMCKICVNCLRTDDCAECVFCKVSFALFNSNFQIFIELDFFNMCAIYIVNLHAINFSMSTLLVYLSQ